MKVIKAGLKGLKPSELIGKCSHVESQMTGNANFVNPSPNLADMTAARVALVVAIAAAESGAHAAVAVKNEAAKNLSTMIVKLARYVNSVAGGDVDMAVGRGSELGKTQNRR